MILSISSLPAPLVVLLDSKFLVSPNSASNHQPGLQKLFLLNSNNNREEHHEPPILYVSVFIKRGIRVTLAFVIKILSSLALVYLVRDVCFFTYY